MTGTFCGTKSSFSPGALKSNGQRCTVGSSSPKLPCPGGDGAVHLWDLAAEKVRRLGEAVRTLNAKVKEPVA